MFDLYFAGSLNYGWEDFIIESGCNRLASWINDSSVVKYQIENNATGKLFIDSGAFTAHKQGIEIDPDVYIEYLNNLDDKIYIMAQLDKIPGRFAQVKTKYECMEAPLLSWKNYLYMRERLKSPDKLLPIFHQNENFDWLYNMLNTTFDGKHIPYIGISPANDKSANEKRKWLTEVFTVIADSDNPNVKTHAFGLTTLPLLEEFPLTSADSTRWIMCSACGKILTPFAEPVISETSSYKKEHIKYMHPIKRQKILDYIEELGYTYEQLSTSYLERAKFCVDYLLRWAKNYTYKGKNYKRSSLIAYKPKSVEYHEELIRKAGENEQNK